MLCFISEEKRLLRLTAPKNAEVPAEVIALQKSIFEKILGWDLTKLAKGTVEFEHTDKDFFNRLLSLSKSVGFYLPPTDLDVVMTLAQKDVRMPQKSTFFYPKLASGLINYELGVV
jgi:uncharacterized protein (DUF1015 family)